MHESETHNVCFEFVGCSPPSEKSTKNKKPFTWFSSFAFECQFDEIAANVFKNWPLPVMIAPPCLRGMICTSLVLRASSSVRSAALLHSYTVNIRTTTAGGAEERSGVVATCH